MANTRGEKVNFLKQFHDEKSLQLQKLSAVQFMEVWMHYDKDGKLIKTFKCQGYQDGTNIYLEIFHQSWLPHLL